MLQKKQSSTRVYSLIYKTVVCIKNRRAGLSSSSLKQTPNSTLYEIKLKQLSLF
jgi:hypothetical protein